MKAVILLSGGLDSTVCLKKAVDEEAATLALTFNYGQKAAFREIESARRICARFSVPHIVVSLPFFTKLGGCALTDCRLRVPEPEQNASDIREVWVPNRNGVFVNVAAAFAESLGLDTVIAGFNAEEARFFPDNSVEFIKALNKTLKFSTLLGIRVFSYTAGLTKKEIATLGREIGAPLELIWSCYKGGRKPCRKCRSCKATFSALTGI